MTGENYFGSLPTGSDRRKLFIEMLSPHTNILISVDDGDDDNDVDVDTVGADGTDGTTATQATISGSSLPSLPAIMIDWRAMMLCLLYTSPSPRDS